MHLRIIVFLAVFALFTPTATIGQKDITVTWGTEANYDRKYPFTDIIGDDGENFYTIRTGRKESIIEKYSIDKLDLIWSKDFILPELGKQSLTLMGTYHVDNQFIVFSEYHSKKERTSTIYAQILTHEGELSSQYKEVYQIEYDEKKQQSGLALKVNREGSKFLLYQNQYFDKQTNEKFAFKVFDSELNLVWEKSFELPYRDIMASIYDVKISDDGNIFMIMTKVPDRKKGEKWAIGIQNTDFSILAFYPETDDLRQYDIDLGLQKWISDMKYTINTQGDIMVTGFYSEKNVLSMDGTFFLKIDKESKEVIVENFKPFDRELKANFLKENKLDKDKELNAFDLRPSILREDGGILQIAEHYFYSRSQHTDANGRTYYTHHYYYKDVMAINISPNGTIEWISVIPKNQHTTNDGGYASSYAVKVNGSNIHFIFNDNPKNVLQYQQDPLKLKEMNHPAKSLSMLSTIDEEGNVRRTPLFSAKDIETIIIPKFNYPLDENRIIFLGVNGNDYKFGIIDFSKY